MWAARVKSVSSYLDDGCLLGCGTAVPHRLTPLAFRLSPHPPPPHLSLLASLAQASSLSSGGHTHSWCVSRAAARCRSVMPTVAKRASGHTHGAHHTLPESSQTLSIHQSPHYHTSCTPMGGLCGDVASPRSTIQVLWSSFRCDDTGTIPFPSSLKNTGLKGLSLNSQSLD